MNDSATNFIHDADAPPAESGELTVTPAPSACYLIQSAWLDGRNRVDGLATISAFASEDAAVGAVLAAYAERFGEKDMRRKARAGKLIVKVRPMSARELANLAALAGAIASPEREAE